VDYQHLEAATTTTGLVSNRREYSSASILADTFSLNAQNIVESNYDPFLKVNVNSVITSRAVDIPQVGQLSSCTDDGRFLALAYTNDDEVKVYEFNNSLVDKKQLSSLGTINTIEMMDVDMNGDGSETFVAKKVGTTQVAVDKFDQEFNSVSSTTLMTTSLALIGASISVSENGGRVAVTATSNHPFNSLPFRHLFLRVHDNLSTNEYYSLYSDYEVFAHPLALMSRNGRIVVVNIGGSVITFEIPTASPSGIVSLSPVHTQIMGIDKFDISYDGKVMLTHSGSDVQIYVWNGVEWKQFGETISTGLSGNIVSVAIGEYARYFVVASSDQIKVYKLNSVYEQYGTIINGDFGSSGHKICISKTGDTVVVGNSQMASYGRAYVYNLVNETIWILVDQIDGSVDTNNLGKYVRLSNNGDKILIGLQNQLLFKTSSLVKIAAGWEQKGGTITSIDTLSLSLSNDGNYLVIGVSDSVKIFNFSQGSWSQYREIIANDLEFMDFGKYVSITMSGSKVAVGSDKNSIVRVYEAHNVDTTVIEPVKNVVDTISLTPQTSLLEMSGDGNRLILNIDTTTIESSTIQSLTVVSTPNGNKYSLDGVTQPTLYLQKGVTYTGIQASIL
jgi:hypothetical protein